MEILDVLLHEENQKIIVQFNDMDLKIDTEDFEEYLKEYEPDIYEMSKEESISDYTNSTIGFVDIEKVFNYDYFLQIFDHRTVERLVKDYVNNEYHI